MSTPDERAAAQDGKDRADEDTDGAEVGEPRSRRQSRLRHEFETLDKEMEVADYATNERGQKRKKLPRKQSLYRTKKRKVLEKEDVKERAIEAEEKRPRLRGAKVAFEDEVVEGSMIFGGGDHSVDTAEEDDPSSNDGEDEWVPDHDGSGDGSAEDDQGGLHTDVNIGSDGDEDDGAGIDDATKQKVARTNGHATLPNRSKSVRRSKPGSRLVDVARAKEAVKSGKGNISRVMYRLKNFKSHKLVERQGDALGAHARGMHRTAIQKLGEVASAAPLSAQVYSSLGLVYENMLSEHEDSGDKSGVEDKDDEDLNGSDDTLASRLAIAKKSYGSYHIAAVMCKKDFTLWVRAADAAMKIVDMHSLSMTMPETPLEEIEKHRAEKKRWLEEAKNDYQAADNLQPPGITVPAKLASVQMDLGNLSEALTILTDLKNKDKSSAASSKNARRGRSELERSYNAWLLYADLMLRIGHECNQWNQGTEKNDNYMFRRWLRKYSQSFDWKERRLQALSLALEAAAGSNACARLSEWTRERSSKNAGPGGSRDKRYAAGNGRWHIDTYDMDQKAAHRKENGKLGAEDEVAEEDANMDDNEADVNVTTPATKRVPNGKGSSSDESESPSSPSVIKSRFEQDRELLLTRNRSELAAFDENTAKIDLVPDSEVARERERERAALIKKHRSAVVALVGEYHQKQASASLQKKSTCEARQKSACISPLPISASCASVCKIAALLMKHFFELDLFHGVSLVGEAVSTYLRERAARHEDGMTKSKNDQPNQVLAKDAFQMHASYDDLNVDSDASDSEDTEIDFISDDEELEESNEPEMLRSMQSGALPSELQVLYALSLFGEGGKSFAARKALSAVTDLDAEDSTEGTIDVGVRPDSSWFSFHRSMVEPLNRTAAFSLAADLFEKTEEEKKKEWTPIAPMFQSHIAYLEQSGFLESIVATNDTSEALTRKNQYLKILRTSLKMQLHRSEELLASSSDLASREKASDSAMSVIENVIRLERALFVGVSPDASLTSSQVEVLKILSRSFSILVNVSPNLSEEIELTSPIFLRLRHLIALTFQVDILPSSGDGNDCVASWQQFPLPSDWQRARERTLSNRAFNLCVGYAVSAVSGWSKDNYSFSLPALMNGSASNFFGINAGGERINGILSKETELELASQWKEVNGILQGMAGLDFEAELAKAKGTSWHTGIREKLNRLPINEALSSCGEDCGIVILLQFSKLCLYAAKGLKESEREGLMKASMSIILPMSQFCLGQILWSSDIGSNTANQVERKEWSYFVETRSALRGIVGGAPSRQPPTNKQRKTPSRQPKPRIRPTAQHYKDSGRGQKAVQSAPLLSKVAKVSSNALLQEWTKTVPGEDCFGASSQSMEQARLAMSRVDGTLTQLRLCTTVDTLQRASIKVASALLEVAARPECNNPFVCLQQAVLFASHGQKLGNNDEVFKKALPLESDCSAEEALMILGRSDCLRAIHFTDEAMFLCTFVARVCRLRRDSTRSELRWTARWRVVSIYAYMVSLAIDSTISSLLDGHEKDAALAAWERDAKEEIGRGRSDAMSFSQDGDNGAVEDESSNGKELLNGANHDHNPKMLDDCSIQRSTDTVQSEKEYVSSDEEIPLVPV